MIKRAFLDILGCLFVYSIYALVTYSMVSFFTYLAFYMYHDGFMFIPDIKYGIFLTIGFWLFLAIIILSILDDVIKVLKKWYNGTKLESLENEKSCN